MSSVSESAPKKKKDKSAKSDMSESESEVEESGKKDKKKKKKESIAECKLYGDKYSHRSYSQSSYIGRKIKSTKHFLRSSYENLKKCLTVLFCVCYKEDILVMIRYALSVHVTFWEL